MNKAAIYSTLCIMLVLCTSEPVYDTTDHISEIFPGIYVSDSPAMYVDRNGEKIDGHFESFYDDGSLEADLTFEDGMIVSGSIWQDGTPRMIYSSDDSHYQQLILTAEGARKVETIYGRSLDDRIQFYVWSDDGKPFLKNDQTVTKTWHQNGQLAIETPLVDGKIHGIGYAWHENGELAAESHFKDDLFHGPMLRWDEKGNLISEKVYDMGNLVSEN